MDLETRIRNVENALEQGNWFDAQSSLVDIKPKEIGNDPVNLTRVALLYEQVQRASRDTTKQPTPKRGTNVDDASSYGRTEFRRYASKELIHRAIRTILADPEKYEVELIGETANKVYEIGDERLKQTLIIKETSYKDCIGEIDTTLRIRDTTTKHDNFLQPNMVDVIQQGGKLYYVMIRSFGPSLMDYLKNEHIPEEFDQVISYLAKIHAASVGKGQEWTRKGRLELKESVVTRLQSSDLDIPDTLIQKIERNYAPIAEKLENSIWVFNKDAHPGNWILTDEGVVAIDDEDKGFVPMPIDLVNLLAYGGYSLDHGTVDEKMQKYIDEFNSNSTGPKIEKREEFKLAYHHAVIHRALTLTGFWSSPDRRSMIQERETVLTNAIESINIIKSRYRMTYNTSKTQYGAIETSLKQLLTHVEQQRGRIEEVEQLRTEKQTPDFVPTQLNDYTFLEDIVAQGTEKVEEETQACERIANERLDHFSFFQHVLALLQFRQGEIQTARETLGKANKTDRKNPDLWNHLSHIYHKLDHPIYSWAIYQIAKKLDKNKASSYCMRMFTYSREFDDSLPTQVWKAIRGKAHAKKTYQTLEELGVTSLEKDIEVTNPVSGERVMFVLEKKGATFMDIKAYRKQTSFEYKGKRVDVHYAKEQTLRPAA